MEHCWHGYGPNTDDDKAQVCCFCGRVYDPNKRLSPPGHGDFHPDKIRPPRPDGRCPLRKPEQK